MVEQQKRGSPPLDNGENTHNSNKKPREHTSPTSVKHERLDGGRRGEEDPEEGEVGQGGVGGSVVPMEAMGDAPQLNNLRMGLELFHCRACLLPLQPPTFKCEDGHVVCGTFQVSHRQACGSAATYLSCAEVDALVRDAKLPCEFQEHGCESYVVYYQAREHEGACPWSLCYCPDPACHFFTTPPRQVDHFRLSHPSWPVSSVSYGKPYRIPMPRPPQGLHVLVGQEDRCVFLVTSSAPVPPVTFISVVCVRANDDTAAGVVQFKCKLWADAPRGSSIVTMLTFPVESSNMSGGCLSPEEQGLLLAVTPKMMAHGASGEAPDLIVRIDKANS